MRAPTYRNLDADSKLFGLSYPLELGLQLALSWSYLLTLPGQFALPAVAVTYAVIRVASFNRPPRYLEHAAGYQLRQALYGGHLSAASRTTRPSTTHVFSAERRLQLRTGAKA